MGWNAIAHAFRKSLFKIINEVKGKTKFWKKAHSIVGTLHFKKKPILVMGFEKSTSHWKIVFCVTFSKLNLEKYSYYEIKHPKVY